MKMGCKCNAGVVVAGCTIAACLASLLIGLLATSFKKLETSEVGLKYDVNGRKLSKEPSHEGLYSYIPGFRFVKFPSVTDTIAVEDLKCLNVDGVTIRLWVTYQYKPRSQSIYKLAKQFKDQDSYKQILKYVGASAIRDVCSRFNVTRFQQDRASFQSLVLKRLTERYDEMESDVIEVQVKNILRPDEYEETISQKEGAREDIQVAEQEEPLKLTLAETKLEESLKEANIRMSRAKSTATIIMTKAAAEAESLAHSFKREAQTYKKIMSGAGMNVEGFLNYMSIRVMENTKKDIYVNLDDMTTFGQT